MTTAQATKHPTLTQAAWRALRTYGTKGAHLAELHDHFPRIERMSLSKALARLARLGLVRCEVAKRYQGGRWFALEDKAELAVLLLDRPPTSTKGPDLDSTPIRRPVRWFGEALAAPCANSVWAYAQMQATEQTSAQAPAQPEGAQP
jgi:hypothetical protein